jgi:methylenetetrahydrofolate reductase (NADPH)
MDMFYTKQKIDAGADFAITQMFFDNHFFYDFMERAGKAGISIPIIPGIMPVTDIEKIKRFSQMSGATLPPSLVERMQKATSADEARRLGIDFATRQCQDLWDNGVRCFHFYTLNRSEAVTEILRNLGWTGKTTPLSNIK